MKKFKFIVILFFSSIFLSSCLARVTPDDKKFLNEVLSKQFNIEELIKDDKTNDMDKSLYYLEDDENSTKSFVAIKYKDDNVLNIKQIHQIEVLKDNMSDIQKATLLKNTKQLGEDGVNQISDLPGTSFNYELAGNDFIVILEIDKEKILKADIKKLIQDGLFTEDFLEENYTDLTKKLEENGFKLIH